MNLMHFLERCWMVSARQREIVRIVSWTRTSVPLFASTPPFEWN